MACFTLRGPEGDRLIPEGVTYTTKPGEAIVPGLIDWGCGGAAPSDQAYAVKDELEKRGVQWGDAIAWVTKKAGIKQCSFCTARQEIFNNVSKVGWAETIRQIKETFK